MRVTSALWVSALIRRSAGKGLTAIVARRGAEEAGAIFIVLDRLDGTEDLYGPAPQSAFDEERPADRRFQRLVERGLSAVVSERMAREIRFDPDVWIVAVEDRAGEVSFDLV